MKAKFVSGLPLTEAERNRDAEAHREALARGIARKHARRSGQRYDSQSTPHTRRITNRMIGERDEE